MSHPVIALVVNFRDARRTMYCVRSLLDNEIYHVVIWDNSADSGVSAAELDVSFAGESRVSIEVSSCNLGFAAGVNRGLQACRQRAEQAWVLLINNDATAPSGLARKLAGALAEDNRALLAFPALMHSGHKLVEVYYYRWLAMLSDRRFPGALRVPRGCCLMLAADRWSGPLFDEDFFMYGEEIELGWRLRARQRAMVCVDDVLVEHEGSASSRLGSQFYEARVVAAHLILARKLAHNRIETRLLYAVRVPTLLSRALIRSLRFHSLTPWLALWRGLRIALGNDPLRHRSVF
jgi:N-acetylglucosaminyl-diphospho-decaprenol L-rhamnosyltransferase